jgi:hypothetical protein
MGNVMTDDEMIQAYLNNNKVTECPEPIEDYSHFDYRRSKQSYNKLHSNKIIQASQLDNEIIKSKNISIEDTALDNLHSIKPNDKDNLVGKSFFSNKDNFDVKILSIDFYINEKTNRTVVRYFCSNGKYYSASYLKNKKFI